MDEAIIIVPIVVIGLPWLIMHYITKWKTAPTMTNDDERMLGDIHDLARRLEDRLETVERLVKADNPNWQPGYLDRSDTALDADNIRKLERNR